MSVGKKQDAKETLEFQTHVSLIMLQEKVTKAKANFIAWSEGREGLTERMGKPVVSPKPSVSVQ